MTSALFLGLPSGSNRPIDAVHHLPFPDLPPKWTASRALLAFIPGQYSCDLPISTRLSLQTALGQRAADLASYLPPRVHYQDVPRILLLIEVLWRPAVVASSSKRLTLSGDGSPKSDFDLAGGDDDYLPPSELQYSRLTDRAVDSTSPMVQKKMTLARSAALTYSLTEENLSEPPWIRRERNSVISGIREDDAIGFSCTVALWVCVYAKFPSAQTFSLLRALYSASGRVIGDTDILSSQPAHTSAILIWAIYVLAAVLEITEQDADADDPLSLVQAALFHWTLRHVTADFSLPLLVRIMIMEWEATGQLRISDFYDERAAFFRSLSLDEQIAIASLARASSMTHSSKACFLYLTLGRAPLDPISAIAVSETWAAVGSDPPSLSFFRRRFADLDRLLNPSEGTTAAVNAINAWSACLQAYLNLNAAPPPLERTALLIGTPPLTLPSPSRQEDEKWLSISSCPLDEATQGSPVPLLLAALLEYHIKAIEQRLSPLASDIPITVQTPKTATWSLAYWQDAFCDAFIRIRALSGSPLFVCDVTSAGLLFGYLMTGVAHPRKGANRFDGREGAATTSVSWSAEGRLSRMRSRSKSLQAPSFSEDTVEIQDRALIPTRKMRNHLGYLARHCANTIIMALNNDEKVPREAFRRPQSLTRVSSGQAASLWRTFMGTVEGLAQISLRGDSYPTAIRKPFTRSRRPQSWEMLALISCLTVAAEEELTTTPIAHLIQTVLQWQTSMIDETEVKALRNMLELLLATLRAGRGPHVHQYMEAETIKLCKLRQGLRHSTDGLRFYQQMTELWMMNYHPVITRNPSLNRLLSMGASGTESTELPSFCGPSEMIYSGISLGRRLHSQYGIPLHEAICSSLSQLYLTAGNPSMDPTMNYNVHLPSDKPCAWVRRTLSELSSVAAAPRHPTSGRGDAFGMVNDFSAICEEAAEDISSTDVSAHPRAAVLRPIIFASIPSPQEDSAEDEARADRATQMLAVLGHYWSGKVQRWLKSSDDDILCPPMFNLGEPMVQKLFTHPLGLPSLSWYLTRLEYAVQDLLRLSSHLDQPQPRVPTSLTPVIANGIVETGLLLSSEPELRPSEEAPANRHLFNVLEHNIVALTDALGSRDPSEAFGEPIVRALARMVATLTKTCSQSFNAMATPSDIRLLNTIFPATLSGSLLPHDMALYTRQPIVAFGSYFSRLSIAARIRRALLQCSWILSNPTPPLSLRRSIRRLAHVPASKRNDIRPAARLHILQDHILANCVRLALCVSRVAEHLIADRENVLDTVDTSACIVAQRWAEAREFHHWAKRAMEQVCVMVSALTMDLLGLSRAGDDRRQRKSILISTLAQLIESTRDLHLLISTDMTTPSRRLRRGARGVWRTLGSRLRIAKQQDRWLRWISRRAPDTALHGLTEGIRAYIDRWRARRPPRAWTIWTSGGVIEGHNGSGSSHSRDELGGWHGGRSCSYNRVQLIWGLLMGYSQNTEMLVANSVLTLLPRLASEYSHGVNGSTTTQKAQKSVKLLLYGAKLGEIHPKASVKPWDFLCAPALSVSILLKELYESRDQHRCLVTGLQAQMARTLAVAPLKILRFYLPQILVSCRWDAWSILENQMIAQSMADDALHKELFTTITSEVATLESLRTCRKGHKGIDSNQCLGVPFGAFGRLRERLAYGLAGKATAHQITNELDFFGSMLELSARAVSILPLKRRTEVIRAAVESVARSHGLATTNSKAEAANLWETETGFTTPFGQPEMLIAINITNCKALKSAAKAPFVVEFIAREEIVTDVPDVCQRLVTRSVIFKTNDDLRMDQVALQMITVAEAILRHSGLPLWLCPYGVQSTYRGKHFGGYIEMVRNTRSRHEIGKDLNQGLETFFRTSLPLRMTFSEAQWNFLRSLAAYSIVSFIMQIKDRHNANMLVTDEGFLVHIDFGFILDLSPAGDIRFERAPFKLTQEMIDLLNAGRSDDGAAADEGFLLLRHLIVEGYMCIRKEKRLIVQMLRFFTDSGLGCFKPKTLRNLRRRLQWDSSDEHARQFITDQVDAAVNALSTRLYDAVQALQQGIAY